VIDKHNKIAVTNGEKTRWVKPGTNIAGYYPVDEQPDTGFDVEKFDVNAFDQSLKDALNDDETEMPDEEE